MNWASQSFFGDIRQRSPLYVVVRDGRRCGSPSRRGFGGALPPLHELLARCQHVAHRMRRAVDRDYVSRRRPRLRCCPGCGRPYRHLLPTAGMLALLLSSGLDLVLAKMALVTSLPVYRLMAQGHFLECLPFNPCNCNNDCLLLKFPRNASRDVRTVSLGRLHSGDASYGFSVRSSSKRLWSVLLLLILQNGRGYITGCFIQVHRRRRTFSAMRR